MSDTEVAQLEEGVGEVKLSKKELNKLKKKQQIAAKKAEVSFYIFFLSFEFRIKPVILKRKPLKRVRTFRPGIMEFTIF